MKSSTYHILFAEQLHGIDLLGLDVSDELHFAEGASADDLELLEVFVVDTGLRQFVHHRLICTNNNTLNHASFQLVRK